PGFPGLTTCPSLRVPCHGPSLYPCPCLPAAPAPGAAPGAAGLGLDRRLAADDASPGRRLAAAGFACSSCPARDWSSRSLLIGGLLPRVRNATRRALFPG